MIKINGKRVIEFYIVVDERGKPMSDAERKDQRLCYDKHATSFLTRRQAEAAITQTIKLQPDWLEANRFTVMGVK